MPRTHLLPPGDYALPDARPGDWSRQPGFDALKELAKGIGDPADRKAKLADDAAELISIPDVWAQTQTFEAALRDAAHPLHVRSLGEWRGLLAILALIHQRDFPVTVEEIRLQPSDPDGGAAIASGAGGQPSFQAVMHTLLPTSVLLAGQSWTRLGVVSMDGLPLALLVPGTLVCPVRDYGAALGRTVEFRQRSRLVDPTTADGVQPEHLHIVARFADHLAQSLRSLLRTEPGPDPQLANDMLQLLNDYAADCTRAVHRSGLGAPDMRQVNLDVPLPHAVFGPLRTVEAVKVAGTFAAALRPRPEFADLCDGAVLADPALARLLVKDPHLIRVWGATTLDQYLRDGRTQERVRDECREAKYLVLGIDDLFAPKLCELNEGAFAHHPKSARKFVLPLAPVALLFFTPKELLDNLEIKSTDVGHYRVTLTVRLHGKDAPAQPVKLNREYTLADRSFIRADRGARMVGWPNFTHPKWKLHYLYHAGNPERDVQPAACLSPDAILSAVKAARGGTPIDNLAQLPTLLKEAQATQHFVETAGSSPSGIFKLPTPPEAVICELGPDQDAVGLILFKPLEAIPDRGLMMHVGIDFGTTNTIVSCRRDEEDPRKLEFADRHVSPYDETELSEDERAEQRSLVSLDFLPPDKPALPFMTLLRQRTALPTDLPEREVVITDRIFFLFDLVRPVGELGKEAGVADGMATPLYTIRTNLKWSNSGSDSPDGHRNRDAIRLFIRQVALHTLAEVAAAGGDSERVMWNFSFPEAFSMAHQTQFRTLLPLAIKDLLPGLSAEGNLKLLPESEAAALYFAGESNGVRRAYFADTVLTLDVGGGTTDVSLWQNRKLLWQSSFMLAGRNLLIDFLDTDLTRANRAGRPNDAMLIALAAGHTGVRRAVEAVLKFTQHSNFNRRAALEMLVNHGEFRRAFAVAPALIGEHPGYDRLAGTAELGLAGILDYIAKVMDGLSRKELFDFHRGAVSICLGGRGSLLFKSTRIEEQETRLCRFFKERAGLPQLPRIEYSHQPKEEVAWGLLMPQRRGGELNTSDPIRDFVIGESMTVGGNEQGHLTFGEDLDLTVEWRVANLVQLQTLVQLAAHHLNRTIDIPAAVFEELLPPRVNDDISRQNNLRRLERENRASSGAGAIGMQPPFIVGLRELIGEIYRSGINLPLRS